MKTYFLRLKNIDFTIVDGQWVSEAIDLYDNDALASMATPSYTNYSTTHSAYGTNLINDDTWTGLNIVDDSASPNIVTESGYVKDGRFVDTTGSINVTTWEINYNNFSFNDIKASISFYYTDLYSLNFPDEWPSVGPIEYPKGIYVTNSPRYARFVLDLQSEKDLSSLNFDLYVRVRISKPVVTPLYEKTIGVVRKFPEWMEIRNDSIVPATPSLATPTTIGGSFINAIAGEWLEDIIEDVGYIQLQSFIETADTSQLAWAYITGGTPDIFAQVIGDGTILSRSTDVIEFTESAENDDIFYWDEYKNTIYTRKVYEELYIDDVLYKQIASQVWNWFDEHGLALDIERHPGESNDSFKKRIIDVYRNKPGVGIQAFKLALRRELNLWLYEGATPDSFYLGATPEVLEVKDILNDTLFMGPDGLPTNKLVDLVDYLANKYPTTWGYFKWDEAYWDIDGEDSLGFGVLPYMYDPGSLSDENVQSGIGDDLDLYVYKPNVNTGVKEFDISVIARGFTETFVDDYSPINMQIDVYGHAEKSVYSAQETEFWLNLFATMSDGKQYRANLEVRIDDLISNEDPGFFGASATIPLVEVDRLFPQINWYDIELERYINSYVTSMQARLADVTGTYVFQMPRGSVFGSSNPKLQSGESISLYSGESYIFGTIEEISESSIFYSDEIDLFDYVTVKDISYNGDLTSLNWTIPWYIYIINEDATPAFMVDNVKVGFGKYELIPEDVIQSVDYKYFFYNHASPTSDKYYAIFAFDAGVIDAATPFVSLGQDIVLHRLSSLIRGSVYHIDTDVSSVSGDPVVTEAKEIALENNYDEYVLLELSSVSGDWKAAAGWEIWNNGYYGFDDYPAANLTTYLSDGLDRATPSNYMEAQSATPGTYLESNLNSFPSVIIGLEDNSIVSDYPWESDAQTYYVTVNQGSASSSQSSWTANVPEILWDPYISATPTKEIFVELLTASDDGQFGAYSKDALGNSIFIPKENIYVNGTNAWINRNTYDATPDVNEERYVIVLDPSTQEIEISVDYTGLVDYPLQRLIYEPFEKIIQSIESGFVDQNGPWRNGIKPKPGAQNYGFTILELDRDDFTIANNTETIVTWIGVSSSNDRVIVWLDQNTVKPAFDPRWSYLPGYPTNSIFELEDSGSFSYTPIIVRAKLKSDINEQWNPQVHSGWFYNGNDEYYMYVDPVDEIASPGIEGSTLNHFYAQKVARQGAPVIVKALGSTPSELRRVSFFDDNINLSLKNSQFLYGTDTENLYLAYDNIYDATVTDTTANVVIETNGSSSDNILNIGETSLKTHVYRIDYKLRDSYYVDNEYVNATGEQRSKFVFDSTPSAATPFSITYEGSIFDPATPVDMALNPFYTTIDEGFLFLSFNEYEAATPQIRISPGVLVADGMDYAIVSIYSVDSYGNPKPNQDYIVETSFGVFEETGINYSTITTNNDGFAFLTLVSEDGSSVGSATVNVFKGIDDWLITTIDITDITDTPEYLAEGIEPAEFTSGDLDSLGIEDVYVGVVGNLVAQMPFSIDSRKVEEYKMYSLVDPTAIPADGVSATSVYGKVLDSSGNPVPYAYVSYKKGRSVYEIFTNTDATPDVGPDASPSATPVWPDSGRILADSSGVFRIGPFVSSTPNQPGYWFVSTESFSSSPSGSWDTVGDVVFWQEYPPKFNSVNGENQSIPVPTNLDKETFLWVGETGLVHYEPPIPLPATVNAFPVTFDEATPTAEATPVTNIWNPPVWYAINRYEQYQRGMLGDDCHAFKINNLPGIHPDYRDV